MRNNNSKQGHGTRGNPQETIEQFETEIKSKELENNLVSNRDRKMSEAKTDVGKNIINELYRPGATVGDGGTADKLIDETNNGLKPGEKGHYQKACERVRQINRVISKGLAGEDVELLKSEKEKLEKALKKWEEKHGKK